MRHRLAMARHHLVPQMLLRRFAEDGRILQASPRDGGSPIHMTVSKACAEAGFYELELEPQHQSEFPL